MKGTFKRALAGLAAAALAATGLALGVGAANAALVDNANIVLTGEIKADENRTFKAFKLGDYTDADYQNGVLNSVGLSTDSDWRDELVTAIGAAQLTSEYTASEYYGNPAAYVASLGTDQDGSALRTIAENLAANVTTDTPSEVTGINTTVGNSGSVTLPVTDDGFYLVTDSMGAPILIGSPVQVTETQYENEIGTPATTLGSATLKPSSVPTPDKGVTGVDPIITFDGKSVYVGETLTYTITVIVPNTTGYSDTDPYGLYIKDVADPGLTISSIASVTLNNQPLNLERGEYQVNGPTVTPDNTTTIVKINNVAGHDGETVVVTYTATVNSNALTDVDGVTNTANVSRDGTNWGQPDTVTIRTYEFDFTKQNADEEPLEGAEFIISHDGTYLQWDDQAKDWSAAADKDHATHISSGTDGKVLIQGLPLGTYTVEEVKAPTGYMSATMPTFTVKIADDDENGIAELTFGDDTWGLVDGDDPANATVTNVENVTQLPLTGAAGTALFTVLGLLIAGAGALAYVKSRNVKHALRG